MYTDKEEKFRAEVRYFLSRELASICEEIEKGWLSCVFVIKLGAMGYSDVMYPEEDGGSNREIVYNRILSEGIAYLNPGADATRGVIPLCFGLPVYRYGKKEQKREYLVPIIGGDTVGAIGITEPGSDAARIETTAKNEIAHPAREVHKDFGYVK